MYKKVSIFGLRLAQLIHTIILNMNKGHAYEQDKVSHSFITSAFSKCRTTVMNALKLMKTKVNDIGPYEHYQGWTD